MKIFTTILLLLPFLGFSQTTELLISEYGEGPSNNKYIEIYNGTGAAVDLSAYSVKLYANGGLTATSTLALTGTLANATAYVITNASSALTNVTAASNITHAVCNFNGDDAITLSKGATVIDVFGTVGVDPGTSWSIAGDVVGALDKIAIRKASVCSPNTNWTTSAGTNATDSEWTLTVFDVSNTATPNIKLHTANCSGTPCPTIPAPTAAAVSVCSGATATLNATASQTGSTLSWYNVATAGTALNTGTSYTTGALTAGTSYWVEETVTGCPASPRTEVVVTVHALPTVNAGTDQTVCSGANVTLAGSGAVSYTWNNSIVNNVPFVINATTTYTVTGTDANNCTNTDAVTVTVSGTAPTVNAGADQTVCTGTSVSLTATGTGTFTWDNGVSQAVPFTATTTKTYTVTVDNGVCTNTDQVTITVDQASVAGTASVSDLSACINDILTASVAGNTGTIEWFVQAPGLPTYISAGTTPTLTTPPVTTAGTYLVKAQVKNGACAMVTTNIVTVVVNALPVISAGVDKTVCAGTQVTLPATGGTTYTWNNGVVNGVAFTPTATTTYTVTGTDANGCVNTDQVVVTVNALPTATTTVSAGTTISAPTGTGLTYQWINCTTNAPIAGATNATYTATANGSYKVTVTNAAGCSATSTCATINQVGIEDVKADSGVTLFPNPTKGKVTINMSVNDHANVTVYNALGKVITSMNNVQTGAVLDLSNNQTGVYMIQVTTEKGSNIYRIVKN